MVIAIDGPAGAGKSSTAKAVAMALGFYHIDSGALYRAATAARARMGDGTLQWAEQDVLASAAHITLAPVPGGFAPRLDGAAIDEELRSPAVTSAVSRVAKMAAVRAWVNEQVRDTASRHDVVVDGRDMGTAVFPDARLKVYLVADPWERARRRLMQRAGRLPSDDDIAEEMAAIIERDMRDASQSVQAPDAVVIDTSSVTQAEQVAQIVALARLARTA